MPSSRVEDLPHVCRRTPMGPCSPNHCRHRRFALTIRLHEADCFSYGANGPQHLAAELRWAAERGT